MIRIPAQTSSAFPGIYKVGWCIVMPQHHVKHTHSKSYRMYFLFTNLTFQAHDTHRLGIKGSALFHLSDWSRSSCWSKWIKISGDLSRSIHGLWRLQAIPRGYDTSMSSTLTTTAQGQVNIGCDRQSQHHVEFEFQRSSLYGLWPFEGQVHMKCGPLKVRSMGFCDPWGSHGRWPPKINSTWAVTTQGTKVNDRFNVWSHWRSQFRPTGTTFTSLSTDEASMIKCLA